jgi:trehalose/maltose hydrolase-like predicted phosphorylase
VTNDTWIIREEGYDKAEEKNRVALFTVGNGYVGVRGSLVETPTGSMLVSNLVNGFFDQAPDAELPEIVNLPNWLATRIEAEGAPLTAWDARAAHTTRTLDLRHATLTRGTAWRLGERTLQLTTTRSVSAAHIHLGVLECRLRASGGLVRLTLYTSIEGDTFGLLGTHFRRFEAAADEDCQSLVGVTNGDNRAAVCAVCHLALDGEPLGWTAETGKRAVHLSAAVELRPGAELVLRKYVALYTDRDGVGDPLKAARTEAARAASIGYTALRDEHQARWAGWWGQAGVSIVGDERAQRALRFCIYHLLIAGPRHSGRVAIPARTLSGLWYRGAFFWDTEMFMAPFFSATLPQVARNLLAYRYHTLDGARRKAARLGFAGAYYAWESMETGDETCASFVLRDPFSGRVHRQHFNDRQVHISADIAYALWRYYLYSGDFNLLLEGGAEVILETARFWLSRALYSPARRRHEIWQVMGPDEWHEDVNNNPYTNWMAQQNLTIALRVWEMLRERAPEEATRLKQRIGLTDDELTGWADMAAGMYIPGPDAQTGIIPQFDRFFDLEDVSVEELLARVEHPDEYLGGPHGLAVETQVSKQADVVLLLSLSPDDYDTETLRRNWACYEARTCHVSSLSTLAYGLLAARLGMAEEAYRYFLHTATADLERRYSPEYGVHPAACGGAWMVAVMGFGGLQMSEDGVRLAPRLPAHWKELAFRFVWHGTPGRVRIGREHIHIEVGPGDVTMPVTVGDTRHQVAPGHSITLRMHRA